MNERITKLCELTLSGKMYVNPQKTEFDREDLFLPREERESKRLCEYILNQEPKLTPYSLMTGMFNFDGSVVGDAFHRSGHAGFGSVYRDFYCKHVDYLSTFEWQHATADYERVLSIGMSGLIKDIENSEKLHTGADELAFLAALKRVAGAYIAFAEKCSERAKAYADTLDVPEYRDNLLRLSETLKRVPKEPPKTFYEAVLTIYFCFSADPDSIGTLDRYLVSFYDNDIASGKLTREEAKEYLQELFLMLQAATSKNSDRFTRGGESHFCIGGYLPDGKTMWGDLSKLIVESLTEMPTYIPQLTLRWTKDMGRDVLYYMMDMERRDPHKRIAFTNDEKRIKCYTEICGIPYEKAVGYTTVGCNEPAFLGSISGSNSKGNIMHPLNELLQKKLDTDATFESFDDFYLIFERELFSDLDRIYDYDNKYNLVRAKDINYVSSLFMNGPIKNAKSLTRGGCDYAICSPMLIGISNVIDSLIVIKQFVFDEKTLTFGELISALKSNWEGYEKLRACIIKRATFFGNSDDRACEISRRLYASLYKHLKDKTNVFGYHILVGDLTGYNEHFKWFGEGMGASPDGRFAGEPLRFGLMQSEGHDRDGLTALLAAIATVDPSGIGCGNTVTNVSLDKKLVDNDESFEKLTDLFLAYFMAGGVHFQLTYVSREDLIEAKSCPEKHSGLRVRVSGFSDYFVKLNEHLQDDVIKRTEQK